MHPYQRLAVWARARAMTVEVYQVTRAFPRDERFGLSAQMKRAAVSIGANIVEGAKRRSGRDFAHFLNIAEGSAAEVAYLAGISGDLGCAPAHNLERIVAESNQVQRMLCALRKRVSSNPEAR